MFTGLIEEIGQIYRVINIPSGKKLGISSEKMPGEIAIGDSVSVSGVCLTVISLESKGFVVEAVGETLNKSTLNKIRVRNSVNLERSLKVTDRLDGHIVQGHVNGVGIIEKICKYGENWNLEINVPVRLIHYIVDEGSIAVDGISLTVANISGTRIRISVIPHTYHSTTINKYKDGATVNIETDILAKFAEKIILSRGKSQITMDSLRLKGF